MKLENTFEKLEHRVQEMAREGILNIRFQPLSMSDLPLMQKWLSTPIVKQWYGKQDYSYE